MEILGIHVFEKRGELEWESEMVSIQALSALAWKKFHGKIFLYTNLQWLEVLKGRGVDRLYDEVHLIPEDLQVDKTKFWAWSKIKIASTQKPPFVLLDTDLWINEPLQIEDGFDLIGYHYEWFDEKEEDAIYVDYRNLIPSEWLNRWNPRAYAINAALLYINNEELLNEWYLCAREIATRKDVEIEDPENVRMMCFIEQRLLNLIAIESKMRVSTFIPQIYMSSKRRMLIGKHWHPDSSEWTEEEQIRFLSIRHIWGGKKIWKTNPQFKEAQLSTAKKCTHRLFGDKYNDIIIL